MANDTRKVFLVDDDPAMLSMLREHLMKSGHYKVSAYASVEELMKKLSAKPDIVVLDYQLDNSPKSASSIMSEIRSRSPKTEVVLISSETSVEPIVEAMRFDAYAVLPRNEHSYLQIEHTLGQIRQKFSIQRDATNYKTLAIAFGVLLLLTIIALPVLDYLGYLDAAEEGAVNQEQTY